MTARTMGLSVCLLAALGCGAGESTPETGALAREGVGSAIPVEPEAAVPSFPVALPALPIDLTAWSPLEAKPLPLMPLEHALIRFAGASGQRVALLGASMSAEDPRHSELRLRLVNCDVQVVCPSVAIEVDGERTRDVALHFDRTLWRSGEIAPCVAPGQEFYAVASLARVPAPVSDLTVLVEGTSEALSAFVEKPAYELEALEVVDGRAQIDAVANRAGRVHVVLVGHGPGGEPLYTRALPATEGRPGQTFEVESDLLPRGTRMQDLTVLFEDAP